MKTKELVKFIFNGGNKFKKFLAIFLFLLRGLIMFYFLYKIKNIIFEFLL